ncbi:MAG TPA: hypothetical protein VFT46_06165 [Holophagaceae bacterium]|nr:hypothetical protein [Holophagaceae bacterium]
MVVVLIVLLVVVVFFAVALLAIRTEELRREDRRREDLPVHLERRKGDRRQGGSGAHFRWKVRTLKGKLKR